MVSSEVNKIDSGFLVDWTINSGKSMIAMILW